MIGILFFGAIAVWALIALVLGVKLPEWLHIQRYRPAWAVVFVVLVFFAPVADEIIAYPQMQVLCASLSSTELANGMNEKSAYGRTIYYTQRRTTEKLFPRTIEITRSVGAYVDAFTKEPVLVQTWFEPRRGMLGIPNGSSGGEMTILLKACALPFEPLDSQNLPLRFQHLNLTVVPTP